MLQILKEDSTKASQFTLDKHFKRTVGSLLPKHPQTQKFEIFFENKDYQKALELWLRFFYQSTFAKSSTGQALHSFLLFQNHFKVLALDTLFEKVNPKKVHPIVYNLWKLEVNNKDEVWQYTIQEWRPEWTSFFNPDLAFQVGSKKPIFLNNKDHLYAQRLLNLPLSQDIDKFSMRWTLILYFIKNNDMELATKTMAWLLKKTKNSENKNEIYLTIARLLQSIGQTTASLHYYQQVQPQSYEWLLSKEEQSWIHYNNNNYDKAFDSIASIYHTDLRQYASPSMIVNWSLMQLKNCAYGDLASSIPYIAKHFSQKEKELNFLLTKDSYKTVVKDLKSYHSSKKRFSFPSLSFALKKDQHLKSLILLRQYGLDHQKPLNKKFKKVKLQQDQWLKNLDQKIKQKIHKTIKKDLVDIRWALPYINLIEIEALYRLQASYHTQANTNHFTLKKDSNYMIYSFQPEEIWLDELSAYKTIFSSTCPKNFYTL